MGSIKDRVAVPGMGCSKFGERWDAGMDDLIVEAAYEAFEDAGIEPKDVQAAWVGSMEKLTGATVAVPLQLQYRPVTRVENACATGYEALRNAAFGVAAKVYDLVLVVGLEKLKDHGFGGLPAALAADKWHPVYGSHGTAPG